jgi:hypothetical protein
MAELAPGEKSYDKQLRPPPGFHTVTAVFKFSGFPNFRVFHEVLKTLGIELTLFVRDEKYVKKAYKARFRWLTDEEVKRILAYRAVKRKFPKR